jgi:hypothetical protein
MVKARKRVGTRRVQGSMRGSRLRMGDVAPNPGIVGRTDAQVKESQAGLLDKGRCLPVDGWVSARDRWKKGSPAENLSTGALLNEG